MSHSSNAVNLSVVIITKNESKNIAACLASLNFVDECIVLDSGSTDDTCSIARSMGATVHVNFDWQGFGVQKNRALSLATGKWVLVIDADERVNEKLANEILNVVTFTQENQNNSVLTHENTSALKMQADIFEIPRLTQFCGKWIYHCGWTPDYVPRLLRRGSTQFSDDLVHERLLTNSLKVSRLKTPLLHYSYESPIDYWRKLQSYSQAWALQRYNLGVKASVWRGAVSAATAFIRSYFFRLGFLDGSMGFAVCVMQAQAAFGKYFALYCLYLKNEKTD